MQDYMRIYFSKPKVEDAALIKWADNFRLAFNKQLLSSPNIAFYLSLKKAHF